MANLPTQPDPIAVTFVRKEVPLGPIVLDGFMLPDGFFRQGLRCTGRAVGENHQRISRIVSEMLLARAKALQGNESHALDTQKAATSDSLQPGRSSVSAEPLIKVVGRSESLLSLDFVQQVWIHVARYGSGESQEKAWELIDALAGVSLERSYQESFGVQDSRNQQDRLLDWFINWNIGPRRVLFDTQFQIQFKRVTGHDINSKSGHVRFIISNFLYNRLPAHVYESIMTLNPADEKGHRKLKHHQLISDQAKLEVILPMISSLKAFLTQAPDGDCLFVNRAMDLLHPTQRGQRKRVSNQRFIQHRDVSQGRMF